MPSGGSGLEDMVPTPESLSLTLIVYGYTCSSTRVLYSHTYITVNLRQQHQQHYITYPQSLLSLYLYVSIHTTLVWTHVILMGSNCKPT